MGLQSAWLRETVDRRAGRPADGYTASYTDRVTRRNGTSTAIEPGIIVVQDTLADEVKAPTAITANNVIGVSVDNTNRERVQGSTETAGYAENEILPVARSGRWYVHCETAATIHGQVHVRAIAGSGETAGHVRNAADASDTFAASTSILRFAETITAAGLVAVEVVSPVGQ